MLDKGGVVGAIFLDFKKAFDTVNHKVLLNKLCNLNFSSGVLNWIESYLSNRPQSVRVGNHLSSSIHQSTGVPQGSILGPLLFSMYINDLPQICQKMFIQMYADDTVLYTHGNNIKQVCDKLTHSMIHVITWLNQSCLQLNIPKTVAMVFT